MKFLSSLCLLLAGAEAVNAFPTVKKSFTSEIAVSSPNPPDVARSTLERRAETCRLIRQVIAKINNNRSQLAFITLGPDTAEYICNAVTHSDPNCENWAMAIKYALLLIFTIANSDSAEPAVLPPRSANSYYELVSSALESSSLQHAGIDIHDLPSQMEKRSTDDPDLLERFMIRSLTLNETTNSNHVWVNHYSNGDSSLHLLPDDTNEPTNHTGNSTSLMKRYNKPGFKIAYAARKKSSLSEKDALKMAGSISSKWQSMVVGPEANEFIGLEEVGHAANFYFRIIPETKGYGLNYESVNRCGQLAPFL